MRLIKPQGDAEKATQTTLDTIEITRKLVATWKAPPFQRDVRINTGVLALVAELQRDNVVPGTITLGVLDGDVYIVDGQHRLHAFMMADLAIAYADVRTHYFKTMAAMADEFVKLNSQLVRLRPDDILKGLEQSNKHLQDIRRKCPYVGYDAIRRGPSSPVVSMGALLRVWFGSRPEVPSTGGHSATACAGQLDDRETGELTRFLQICFQAWRREKEYQKLWSALNLCLCAWLYRRVVLGPAGKGTSRATKMTEQEFIRGMLALSADANYVDYLVGRNLGDKDRAPAYNRMKSILAKRYADDHGGTKLMLPQPTWSHG